MNVQTYLFFDGCCQDAIHAYELAFNARVAHMIRFSEAPEPLRGSGRDHFVFHSTLRIGETLLNLADDPANEHGKTGGFALLVHLDSNEKVDLALEILADGGNVQMPAQITFWAERYAIVVDRFGVKWKLQHSS